MYGHRSRRIKTDRRDVAALVEACQQGTDRLAHRRSARQHEVQCRLNVRREVTQARTRAISIARAITRAAGLRIPSGNTETFLTRLRRLDLSPAMKTTLSPLRSVIEVCDDELAAADEQFEALVAADPMVKRLTTLPAIGPITATAFVAALDTVSRFDRAAQVTSYLGLVPHEYSSGEKQRRGRIVRSAHPHLQSLLVQAAWRMSRSNDPPHGIFPHVGASGRSTARQEGGDGGAGTPLGADAVCDVARSNGVSTKSHATTARRCHDPGATRGDRYRCAGVSQ
jgi:transposase